MGRNKTSAGTRNTELSTKAITASQIWADGRAASERVQSYRRRNMKLAAEQGKGAGVGPPSLTNRGPHRWKQSRAPRPFEHSDLGDTTAARARIRNPQDGE